MRNVMILGAVLLLTAAGSTILLAMGKKPPTQETAVKTEQLALKCTKGGCPGGEGFCCLTDQRRLQSALQGVKGVSQVIPDKAARTFTVAYPKGQVALADLKTAAQQAGFEVVEARKLQ
jgi:hypothetical protein